MNSIRMNAELAPQSHVSKKYSVAHALGRSALFWLEALAGRFSEGLLDGTNHPEGDWLPLAKVQELWVYTDILSRTFHCVDDAQGDLFETYTAHLDFEAARHQQQGEDLLERQPLLVATTYSALAHLNALAVLTPQVAGAPSSSGNDAKLGMTCAFLYTVLQNLREHVATFLACEKGMPLQDFHHLVVCAAVAQDMLRSLDESEWDPDGPVPAFVTARLNKWMKDPSFLDCDLKEIDALMGDAVRAVERVVLVEADATPAEEATIH